jgi:hypothetical protein
VVGTGKAGPESWQSFAKHEEMIERSTDRVIENRLWTLQLRGGWRGRGAADSPGLRSG